MISLFSVIFAAFILSTSTCYAMNPLSDRQLSSVTSNAGGPRYFGQRPAYQVNRAREFNQQLIRNVQEHSRQAKIADYCARSNPTSMANLANKQRAEALAKQKNQWKKPSWQK